MNQSPLGNVLGHLAQRAERQGPLHQAQNEVLSDLAQSLAADRAMRRELLASGGPATHIPKMGEADDAEAFIKTFQGVAERDYDAITRAIRDRLGLYPEEHRRRFRALAFSEGDRPFAQQLRDQARSTLCLDRSTLCSGLGPATSTNS
ncbi:unnamed protein product [Arctogadus glacialis]